jgi:hypothetical protein
MATKSSVGWLILAFALAVPGVLFYQWYTHLDLEKKKALGIKVRLQDTGLFQSSPKKDKLVNPIAPVAVPIPIPVPVAVSSTPAAVPDNEQVATAAPPPTDDLEVPKASSAPAANSFLAWRDPTLSPHDQVRIEQLELEKQIRIDELKAAAEHKAAPVRKPPVQIEKLVDLQGIVSTPESGNRAIVNGEVVSEGDLVKTSAGPVKVLRITTQAVGFAYKDKRFNKSVNR